MSKPATSRHVSLAVTIVTATLAPLVVFLYFAVVTSDGSPRQLKVASPKVTGYWSPIPGRQGAFHIGPRPTRFSMVLPPDAPRGRLTFDLYLRQPIMPQIQVSCWKDLTTSEPSGFVEVTRQLRGLGRNQIVVDFDDGPGYFEAEGITIEIVSPNGANIAGLTKIQLESFSFSQRWSQLWSRLFAHQKINVRSINFIESNHFAGWGVPILFWAGFVVAMVVLLLRRFLLRERVALLTHSAFIVVVLVVLADLRNSGDYYRDARQSVSAWAESETFFDQLGTQENGLPWFTPTVKFLRENVSLEQQYYIEPDGPKSGLMRSALIRFAYYARPVRRTDKLDEADFALLLNGFSRPPVPSNEWKRIETLPGGVIVFEHIQ